MNWNNIIPNMGWYDDYSRRMDAIGQLNKFAEISTHLERMTNPLGMDNFLKVNEQLERLANPLGLNHILEINERMERLANPFGKLTAFMEQQDRMLNWNKSMAVLSPVVTTALDYFHKFDKLQMPSKLDTMLGQMNIGNSLNAIYTMMERTSAIEKNFALFDHMSEFNDRAYNETNDVVAQSITLEEYQASMMQMLREGFEHLRSELLKSGKPQNTELTKLFDRWLTIISIIVTCIGIYVGVKGLQGTGNESHTQEQLMQLQADTIRTLKQFIQQSTKKIWVSNRKCAVRFKPLKNSLIVDSLPALSSVDVIAMRQKWAYVTYYTNDTTVNAGWIDKVYIDTIKNLKRPGNNSMFNKHFE